MNISIVSGTYNRRAYLQNMMQSVQNAIPPGISHEFVIVDGGSTDGTVEWLITQPNITLIEHGELRGAIPAFCDGCRAAKGDYVVMANDDISFHPDSIMRALSHFQTHPQCGAVAFADNRPIWSGYDSTYYKVQTQPAKSPAGQNVFVPYAQVGMFPRWLGDLVGWWGDEDEEMQHARTYGGDNFLSARIWEMGYTVDVIKSIDDVHLVRIDDHMIADEMRIENSQYATSFGKNHPDTECYFRRFPDGHAIAGAPQVDNELPRRLRILYLPIYEPGHVLQHKTKCGLREALGRVGLVWELDYLSAPNWPNMLFSIMDIWKPDLILSQFHNASAINASTLAKVRELWPDTKIVNWHGDPFPTDDKAYLKLLEQVDLQLVVDATGLEKYPNSAYWQIGYEKTHEALPEMPAHDVLFLGNRHGPQRGALEEMLTRNGWNVGLYGRGWKKSSGENLYNFDAGAALYDRAAVAISDTHPGTKAFVSNRFFQALAAGAFLLQQRTPDFEAHNPGLVEGKHYVGWDTIEDLEETIVYWLDGRRASKRDKIRRAGQAVVLKEYSFDRQIQKLFGEILPEVFA